MLGVEGHLRPNLPAGSLFPQDPTGEWPSLSHPQAREQMEKLPRVPHGVGVKCGYFPSLEGRDLLKTVQVCARTNPTPDSCAFGSPWESCKGCPPVSSAPSTVSSRAKTGGRTWSPGPPWAAPGAFCVSVGPCPGKEYSFQARLPTQGPLWPPSVGAPGSWSHSANLALLSSGPSWLTTPYDGVSLAPSVEIRSGLRLWGHVGSRTAPLDSVSSSVKWGEFWSHPNGGCEGSMQYGGPFHMTHQEAGPLGASHWPLSDPRMLLLPHKQLLSCSVCSGCRNSPILAVLLATGLSRPPQPPLPCSHICGGVTTGWPVGEPALRGCQPV